MTRIPTSFKANLLSWATGLAHAVHRPAGASATVMVQDPADLTTVLSAPWCGPETVVFGPSDDPSLGVIATFGRPTEWPGELQVGDNFFLQVHGYAIARYLTMLGPTLVRTTDPEDLQAFLEDADTARQDGRFSPVLLHPKTHLADPGTLGRPTPQDGPGLRVHVDDGHRLRLSPDGPVLAWDLATAEPDLEAPLRLEHPDPAGRAAVAARPWLGRYLVAVEAVQSLVARGLPEVAVSGFGGRFFPATPTELCEPAGSVVLLRSDAEHYLYEPGTARTFRISPDGAVAVETLLSDPDEDSVASRAVRATLERTLGERVGG